MLLVPCSGRYMDARTAVEICWISDVRLRNWTVQVERTDPKPLHSLVWRSHSMIPRQEHKVRLPVEVMLSFSVHRAAVLTGAESAPFKRLG
jgi:hypothetical protein